MNGGPMPNDAAEKFLERDFNQCFTQMRHYDGQILDIVKFTFTTYTAIIGVVVGLYQFSKKEHHETVLIPVTTAIASVGFLFGVLMTTLIVRNRVYFVVVARYINEHRRLFLKGKPLGLENKARMYTSISHPHFFNWRSSQSLMLYLVVLLNSVMFAAILFPYIPVKGSVGGGAGCFLALLLSAVGYLTTRDGKSADRAVFGTDGPSDIHTS